MLVKVNYQIGCYSGSVYVNADENDEDETIINRAKAKLQKDILMPNYEITISRR